MSWFNNEDKPSVKDETHNIQVLKFGTDARGDTVTAEGASVPNEVAVFKDDTRSVGRAVLHVREDGIYADLMFSNGGLDERTPKAIVIVHASEPTAAGRNVTRYEISGVGLESDPETQEEPSSGHVVESDVPSDTVVDRYPVTETPVQTSDEDTRDPDGV